MPMKIGDKVSWTQSSQKGRIVHMRLRKGIIQDIQNTRALIRLSSGKVTFVSVDKLRSVGEQSEITQFVETMKKATKEIL
jgi:hypothetical protein